MTAKQTSHNKMSNVISEEEFFQPELGFFDMASEALFGKSEPVLELPQSDSRSSKKRLG